MFHRVESHEFISSVLLASPVHSIINRVVPWVEWSENWRGFWSGIWSEIWSHLLMKVGPEKPE